MWGYVAMAGVQALGSYFGGGGDASAINAHNREVARRNKAIVESNLENRIRTGYQVGILNMQLSQQRMQHARHGAELGTTGLQASGTVQNNAAAAGQIGASVQAVQADVDMQVQQARQDLIRSWDATVTNYNTDLRSIIDQGNDAQLGADGQVQSGRSTSVGEALMQGAMAAGQHWLGSQIQLGLGRQQPAPPSPSLVPQGRLGSGYHNLNNATRTGFNLGSGLSGVRF